MEPTIFFNVAFHQDGDNSVSIVTTRIWPELIRLTKWILKQRIPAHIAGGVGIDIINNAAIIVEGFVTDLIVEEYKSQSNSQPIHLKEQNGTWQPKIKAYNKIFPKRLDDYEDFDTIDMLFAFRNSIAHGRSHSEIKNKIPGQKTVLESDDKNYQKVRMYLLRKKYITEKEITSNADVLWNLRNAAPIYFRVIRFILELSKNHTQKHFEAMFSELDYACNFEC